MLSYVTIGTNDLEKSGEFYDQLFSEIGVGRAMVHERFIVWGKGDGGAGFSVVSPYDGEDASVGNGTMVALRANDPETVDKIYNKAIELGATCEGEPGPRDAVMPGLYVGYFRDLDGNKINCIHFGSAA